MKRINAGLFVLLIVECLAFFWLVYVFSSCKTQKQAETKHIEKSEIVLDVKTNETISSSVDNIFRNIFIESINRDFFASLKLLNFSAPDSAGNQYITSAVISDFTDKSKIDTKIETVDSTGIKTAVSTTIEENSKLKEEIKEETKVTNKTEALNIKSILIIVALFALAVFIFIKTNAWAKLLNLIKTLYTAIRLLFS